MLYMFDILVYSCQSVYPSIHLSVFQNICEEMGCYTDWIGLRENLPETIDFPVKYGSFL